MSDRSRPGTDAALALRDAFGDRKLPDISRKITACVTCRKLKIKCRMTHEKPPCVRCKANNLSCVVNKSLQTLLESDATWKEAMEQRICKLEQALADRDESNAVFLSCQPPPALPNRPDYNSSIKSRKQTSSSTPQSATTNNSESTLDLSCSLGAFPASSITTLTTAGDALGAPFWPDLISRGIVTLSSAERHLAFFKQYLDPSIHHALGQDTTIASVRARSSLLTNAICTVASLCAGSEDYAKCFADLKDEVTHKLFADKYTFDDVLAFCIGALWLRDISATLQGLAVRISSQLDLHRCITKMPHTDISCYRRTRLFFLVFLCDHHCSLICGKPPMTQEWRCLKHPATLLQSEFSTNEDLFLVCQVELWSLNRRVFETFGADVHDSAASRNGNEVERLVQAFDAWYGNWRRALGLVGQEDPKPRLQFVLELYYYSAGLCLLSHVFRGKPTQNDIPNPRAQIAFENALYIIQTINACTDASEWLNALPWYFYTMLAFASVCLVRIMAFQPGVIGDMYVDQVCTQLHQLVALLRQIPAARRPLVNIADCLESALSGRHQNDDIVVTAENTGTDVCPDINWDSFWNESIRTDLLGDEAMWMTIMNENTLN